MKDKHAQATSWTYWPVVNLKAGTRYKMHSKARWGRLASCDTNACHWLARQTIQGLECWAAQLGLVRDADGVADSNDNWHAGLLPYAIILGFFNTVLGVLHV